MRLLNHIQSERGESLIALMVGIAVGLIVLSGAIAFYVNTVSSNRQIMEARLLNQDLKATMAMMVREIRRAQYIGKAEQYRVSKLPGETCPEFCQCPDVFCDVFSDEPRDFSLSSIHPTLANVYRAIEFSYDRHDPDNNPNNPPSQDDNFNGSRVADECFGFRLNTVINAVEMKTDCNPNTPTWIQLTDPETVRINDLRLLVRCTPPSSTNDHGLWSRVVEITLIGALAADATRTLTLNELVQVRAALLLKTKPIYCAP